MTAFLYFRHINKKYEFLDIQLPNYHYVLVLNSDYIRTIDFATFHRYTNTINIHIKIYLYKYGYNQI